MMDELSKQLFEGGGCFTLHASGLECGQLVYTFRVYKDGCKHKNCETENHQVF